MEYTAKEFDKRLRSILICSGTRRESLAKFVGVSVPVMNRWLSGASVPDVYQLREIVRYFGVPYEWFLHGSDGAPTADEIAEMLGLSTETVEHLLDLAVTESDDVMEALDDAIYSITSAIAAVREDVE